MAHASQGITWSKWDLHVHTPSSIAAHTYGSDEKAWEEYLRDLEALPEEFKVLGINDYLWFDGYKRLRKAKQNGRLKNIDLLLPVVELRVSEFGGVDGKMSRINFHVIFSPELDTDIITAQFINSLEVSYTLSADGKQVWSAAPTRDSLAELGKKIKENMPDSTSPIMNESDIHIGFSNLNFNVTNIKSILSGRHYFEGKYLTVIGRTEFADMRWSNQFIADKKHFINDVDFIFTASPSVEEYDKAKNVLVASKLNSLLLDCSDAHHNSCSTQKDRVGNCFTWLKTEHSFNGLKLIKHELDRIFVGDMPPVLARVANNKTKYIKSLLISKEDREVKGNMRNMPEPWFDGVSINLNPELVAIIGNKGNGKTAILDILALLGNSKVKEFSFLNNERFRNGENKSQYFNAKLIWHDNNYNSKYLDEQVNQSEVERVKYLPQDHFEEICNSLGDEFEQEIKNVIFSYVGEKDKANVKTLDELLELKSKASNEAIKILQQDIEQLNTKIAYLESRRGKRLIVELEKKIELKNQEIRALEATPPDSVPEPEAASSLGNNNLNIELGINSDKIESLSAQIVEVTAEYNKINAHISVIKGQLVQIRKLISDLNVANNELTTIFSNYDKQSKPVIEIKYDEGRAEEILLKLNDRLQIINLDLDENSNSSLFAKLSAANKHHDALVMQLDAPSKEYEKYLRDYELWQRNLQFLQGSRSDAVGHVSLLSLTDELNYLRDILPTELAGFKQKRLECVQQILENKKQILVLYREVYSPINEKIVGKNDNKTVKAIAVNASISCENFSHHLFTQISRNTASGFAGIEEGSQKIAEIISQANFENIESVIDFLSNVLKQVSLNNAIDEDEIDNKHLRKGFSSAEFYNWLFSLNYLQHRYSITLNGKGLDKLSPGEKGALLIIFYLSLDQSEIPLLIDQPEENLDNQSISAILVPFIKEAKSRRQIIIVTHNPNLAVVCDAEQIIHVKIDKENSNLVSVISGAIESVLINPRIVDVLEGTMPAFDTRNLKYDVARMLN